MNGSIENTLNNIGPRQAEHGMAGLLPASSRAWQVTGTSSVNASIELH